MGERERKRERERERVVCCGVEAGRENAQGYCISFSCHNKIDEIV
jgi:hypothetical protein